MSVLHEKREPFTDYWGDCPTCGLNDGFINVEQHHFYVCHAHKAYWWIGSNLFSGWRDERDEEWEENRHLLEGYTTVEPAYGEGDR
jgi:hypothetical protein